MRLISLRLPMQATVLALVASTAGHAADPAEIGAAAYPKQSLQAKLEYCKTCHGLAGQGYRGYFAMPRLAGQQPKYIENQLHAFIEHRRRNAIMTNAARALNPSMVAALAQHFKDLDPRPLQGAPKDQVAAGKKIYEEGVPESNVPACPACHGAEAKGLNEIPRLAGQLYPYTIKVLTNWSKERGQDLANPDTSSIMAVTAHNLTQAQIAEIAAYVSTLN